MKREKYIQLSRQEARKVLSTADYKKLRLAAKSETAVSFTYTDKDGTKAIYRAVQPQEFFYTPGWSGPEKKEEVKEKTEGEEEPAKEIKEVKQPAVYLWSFHRLHRRDHSFRADRIKKVNFFPTFIQALTDPEKYKIYWIGGTVSIKTTVLSTGSLP